jgi:hypothetical protein
MASTIDNKKDILLLLLYSPGQHDGFNEPVVGRTRLVKMLFLFSKECLRHFRKGTKITEESFYEFFAWDFGPFSKQVYDDIMFFVLRDFIETDVTEEEVLPEAAAEWEEWMRMSSEDPEDEGVSEYDEQSFTLSAKGLRFAKSLYEALSPEQKATLRAFKAKLNSTPLSAILRYVYEAYPDFTEKSLIREKVTGHK